MTSNGQTPSRSLDDKPVQVRISDVESGDPVSRGGGASRGMGGPPGTTPASVGGAADDWFPKSPRYKRLSDPIKGGMGVVYKALDVNLDIEVAIKRIRPELAADADLINRFEREARLQVRLRHPNLVHVRDYLKDNIGPYIVMDWIEGESLAAAIDKAGVKKPMEWDKAAVLISKVAMALQVGHEAGIIHRDVKPANILLDANEEPFITDFGLARIETTQSVISETATNAMLGTINFASPEQQRNPRNACFQSDIWSLGATLYKILTTYDMTYFRESLIPKPLRSVVMMATEHAIDARFSTMRLMSQTLQRALTADGANTPSSRVGTVAEKSRQGTASEESDLASMWRQTQECVEKAHKDAKELAEKRQDYSAAVQILESVPEHLRKARLFDELVRRRDRVAELDGVIRESVAQFRSEGLKEAIEELLKLQPNRQDVRRLLQELPVEPPPRQNSLPAQPQSKVTAAAVPPAEKKPVSPLLLVAPFNTNQAKAAQEAWAKHLGIGVEVTNSLGMKFRIIPPGTFELGSPNSEPQRSGNETLHKVTITQPKLLGVYPVTQAEWTKVMGTNRIRFKSVSGQDTNRFPVEEVSWDDCQEFLERMNESHAMKGWRYRLPTEAEWEYACRAGTVTPFWFGGELNGKQANCDGNNPYQCGKGPYLERTCVVGSYGANPFGLYDQHGNVWEWCQDWFAAYDGSVTQDPTGPSSGSSRVLRGGSWSNYAGLCRSAFRHFNFPSFHFLSIGFRVLCELS